MATNSAIEWTDHTFNAWRGCTKVSEGCANCYAETMSKRNPLVLGVWGPSGKRPIAAESYWSQLAKWEHDALADGVRRRVFCASLSDVFEGPETVHDHGEYANIKAGRARLFGEIEIRRGLDFLLLTKRPRHVMEMVPDSWRDGFPPNVWLGTSVENQDAADRRIPHLVKCPAAVRFLSIEPMIGPVDLTRFLVAAGYRQVCERYPSVGPVPAHLQYHGPPSPDWVIVGGESGPNARPIHPAWARSVRDQCKAAGVPFLFKQWGEWKPTNPVPGGDLGGDMRADRVRIVHNNREPDGHFRKGDCLMRRCGKKAAGRLLDGVTHDGYPERLA